MVNGVDRSPSTAQSSITQAKEHPRVVRAPRSTNENNSQLGLFRPRYDGQFVPRGLLSCKPTRAALLLAILEDQHRVCRRRSGG